jgi:hypothetical protein
VTCVAPAWISKSVFCVRALLGRGFIALCGRDMLQTDGLLYGGDWSGMEDARKRKLRRRGLIHCTRGIRAPSIDVAIVPGLSLPTILSPLPSPKYSIQVVSLSRKFCTLNIEKDGTAFLFSFSFLVLIANCNMPDSLETAQHFIFVYVLLRFRDYALLDITDGHIAPRSTFVVCDHLLSRDCVAKEN